MFPAKTITTREVLRHHKLVFKQVQQTQQPAVVVSQNEPQVAIISLNDLHELEYMKQRRATKALLNLAGLIKKGSGLSTDLSEKHNEYTWD